MSTIPLVCAATHAAIPALMPGDVVRLEGDGANLFLMVPCTVLVLQRLAQALKAKALRVLPNDPDPLDLIEADVDDRHRELMRHIEEFLRTHTTSQVA